MPFSVKTFWIWIHLYDSLINTWRPTTRSWLLLHSPHFPSFVVFKVFFTALEIINYYPALQFLYHRWNVGNHRQLYFYSKYYNELQWLVPSVLRFTAKIHYLSYSETNHPTSLHIPLLRMIFDSACFFPRIDVLQISGAKFIQENKNNFFSTA